MTTDTTNIEAWNTNRVYTPEGQIIVAQRNPDGSILFADVSRGVYGTIKPNRWQQRISLRDRTMLAYDHGHYVSDTNSLAFFNAQHKCRACKWWLRSPDGCIGKCNEPMLKSVPGAHVLTPPGYTCPQQRAGRVPTQEELTV